MSSDEIAIRVRDVTKHYLMFDRPEDRLKQMIVPRLQRLARQPPARYYRDFAALNSISFDIKRGETVGIIGRNGCGKSTLLQIVCGTLPPTSGTVEVHGRIAALLELGAGFNPEFTGRENVFMNAAILGLSHAETEARFDAIARFADIGMFIDQPVKTYSSGMYVRLAFATAINVDPDILVVDEALSVGDEAFQRKCFARIEDIKDKGGTILFVSHGAQTIVQLCDRAMLIDRGELILEGRPKAVVGQYQRLVNASAEGAPAIRAAILEMRDAPPESAAPVRVAELAEAGTVIVAEADRNGATLVEAAPQAAAFEAPPPAAADDGRADYFDANLVSQSVVELESRGARIRDVRITTLDGKPVNVLRMGKRYVLSGRVDVFETFDWLGFGFSIRTPEGFQLYGFSTDRDQSRRTCNVQARSTLSVSFEISNELLMGVYFVSLGVFAFKNGDRFFAHRIGDAVVFRVAADGVLERGYIGLSALERIEIVVSD